MEVHRFSSVASLLHRLLQNRGAQAGSLILGQNCDIEQVHMVRSAEIKPEAATGLALRQDDRVSRRRILLPISVALGIKLHAYECFPLRRSQGQQRELLPVRSFVEAIEKVFVGVDNRTKCELQSAQFRDG